MTIYGHSCSNFQQRRVVPLFSYLGMLFIYEVWLQHCSFKGGRGQVKNMFLESFITFVGKENRKAPLPPSTPSPPHPTKDDLTVNNNCGPAFLPHVLYQPAWQMPLQGINFLFLIANRCMRGIYLLIADTLKVSKNVVRLYSHKKKLS